MQRGTHSFVYELRVTTFDFDNGQSVGTFQRRLSIKEFIELLAIRTKRNFYTLNKHSYIFIHRWWKIIFTSIAHREYGSTQRWNLHLYGQQWGWSTSINSSRSTCFMWVHFSYRFKMVACKFYRFLNNWDLDCFSDLNKHQTVVPAKIQLNFDFT